MAWLAGAGLAAGAAGLAWWSGLMGKALGGAGSGPGPGAGRAGKKPVKRLMGSSFPKRVETMTMFVPGEAVAMFGFPPALYVLSEPYWVKRGDSGPLVERVTLLAYSLLRPFHGLPYRPALQFHVALGMEYAYSLQYPHFILIQRKVPDRQDVLEVRVGNVETGLWKRKLLTGLTPTDLIPGTSLDLTEALWSYHFDLFLLKDGSIILMTYWDRPDDKRVVSGWKLEVQGGGEKAEDGLETEKLHKKWGAQVGIAQAAQIRRKFYRVDRLLAPEAGKVGFDFGRNEDSGSLVCLLDTEKGEWSVDTHSEAKFPPGTHFAESTRVAVKIRSADSRRQYSHVFVVDREDKVWEIAVRDPPKLRGLALRTLIAHYQPQALANLLASAKPPLTPLLALLDRHAAWNPQQSLPLRFF